MDAEQLEAMAADFARYVRERVARLRSQIVFDADHAPGFVPGATRELRAAISELSPDAARYALVAALIALAGSDFKA